jgi:hypothetical protein
MLTGRNLLALLFLGAAMWGAAWLAIEWRQYRLRRKLKLHAHQGRQGEQAALRLLQQSGYHILDTQRTQQAVVHVDGTPHSYRVRADYLVESHRGPTQGQRYVVEVKTGHEATQPTTRATRRQLLEYQQVYDVDGVLLADMQLRKLHHIRFDSRQNEQQMPSTSGLFTHGKLIAALLIGFLAGLILAGQR